MMKKKTKSFRNLKLFALLPLLALLLAALPANVFSVRAQANDTVNIKKPLAEQTNGAYVTPTKPGDPLCFRSETGGAMTLSVIRENGMGLLHLSYSFDGAVWNDIDVSGSIAIDAANGVVYVRGTNENGTAKGTTRTGFDADVPYSVSGDVTTLVNLNGNVSELPDSCFSKLFMESVNLHSAKDLILPSDKLGNAAYSSMFFGCTEMTEGPLALGATQLAQECYASMFAGCTALLKAPSIALPEEVPAYAFESTFAGCTSLTEAPDLPAARMIGEGAFWKTFSGCESLEKATVPTAIRVRRFGFREMYKDCTSLESVPELPATQLEEGAYLSMFEHCTSLKSAMASLEFFNSQKAHARMFANCTALRITPTLYFGSDTSNATDCEQMFLGCSSLEAVDARFTTWDASFNDWLKDVSATGVVATGSFRNVSEGNGKVPAGWTVAEEIYRISFDPDGGTGEAEDVYLPRLHGETYTTYEFPYDLPFTAPAGCSLLGYAYESGGDLIYAYEIDVTRSMTLYAVWGVLPTITDQDGNYFPNDDDWYLSPDMEIMIFVDGAVISGKSEFPIAFKKDVKNATFKDLEIVTGNGTGVGISMMADMTFTLIGENTIDLSVSGINGTGLRAVGIKSAERLMGGKNGPEGKIVFAGDGSLSLNVKGLSVDTGDVDVCGINAVTLEIKDTPSLTVTAGDAISSDGIASCAFVYGVMASDMTVEGGSLTVTAGNANARTLALSRALDVRTLSVTGGSLSLTAGSAISDGEAHSAALSVDETDLRGDGRISMRAGGAYGNESYSSRAMEGGFSEYSSPRVTVDGSNEGNASGCVLTQKEGVVPVSVYCVPQVRVTPIEGAGATYGTAASDTPFYTVFAPNFKEGMRVVIEWYVDGAYRSLPPDGITASVVPVGDDRYEIRMTTVEDAPCGDYGFRVTNDKSGTEYAGCEETFPIRKRVPPAPTAPKLVRKTDNTIAVVCDPKLEYTVDGKNWVRGDEETLTFHVYGDGATYTVRARYPETANTAPSGEATLNVLTYTKVQYSALAATERIDAAVREGETPDEELSEILRQAKEGIRSASTTHDVETELKLRLAEIALYYRKCDAIAELDAAGESAGDTLSLVIRFAKARVNTATTAEKIDAAKAEGLLDIERQKAKDALDALVADMKPVPDDVAAVVSAAKKAVAVASGNAIKDVEADAKTAILLAIAKYKAQEKLDVMTSQMALLSVEMTERINEAKIAISRVSTIAEVNPCLEEQMTGINLRIAKDAAKIEIEDAAGASPSHEMRTLVADSKKLIENATTVAEIANARAIGNLAITMRKASEELQNAKSAAKTAIEASLPQTVDAEVEKIVLAAKTEIDKADTLEKIETAKQNAISEIRASLEADRGFPWWGTALIVIAVLVLLTAVFVFLKKKFGWFRQ